MNKSEEEGALSKTFEDMLYKTQNRRADITDREILKNIAMGLETESFYQKTNGRTRGGAILLLITSNNRKKERKHTRQSIASHK
jgi:hypothetical protein